MRAEDPDEVLADLFDPELAAALEAAAAEHRDALAVSVIHQLRLAQARGTPVRAVSRFTGNVVRVQFADNSAVLVRCGPVRHLARLAVAVVRNRPVVLSRVYHDGCRVHAVMHWDKRDLDLEVLGGDQLA